MRSRDILQFCTRIQRSAKVVHLYYEFFKCVWAKSTFMLHLVIQGPKKMIVSLTLCISCSCVVVWKCVKLNLC